MRQKSGTSKQSADKLVKNIRRKTRQTYSAEEKIRIVLAGLRGEESINLDTTATDPDTADYKEQFTLTVIDPDAGLPVYQTATSGDDVFTLGGSQYTTARGGNGDVTYIILPSLTNNASIFDLRGANTIVFQEDVEIVAGDETPGIYYLHLGTGATLEVNNAEGQLFQIGNGPALSFDDFRTAIAGSPTVDTSASSAHGTPIDQAAVFVPAKGDNGGNTIALGHNTYDSAAGSTGNDTVIAIDNAEAYDFQVGDTGITTDFTGLEALLAGGPIVINALPQAAASGAPYSIQLKDNQLDFSEAKTTGVLVLDQEGIPGSDVHDTSISGLDDSSLPDIQGSSWEFVLTEDPYADLF